MTKKEIREIKDFHELLKHYEQLKAETNLLSTKSIHTNNIYTPFCSFCKDCIDCKYCLFCRECFNCHNCVCCTQLVAYNYMILNVQFTQKEYTAFIQFLINTIV